MLDDNISVRFNELLDSLRIGIPELTKTIGGTHAKFYKIAKGEVKPNYDTLFDIMKAYPRINGDWLLSGRGEMFVDAKPVQTNTSELERENQHYRDKIALMEFILKEKGVLPPKFSANKLLPVDNLLGVTFSPILGRQLR